MAAFLSEYDLSGITISPFCAHEGSQLGHSEKDIGKLCPKATVSIGLAIRGSQVSAAQEHVANWLRQTGLTG